MLLAVIHLGYQHILRRFAQDVLFANAFHFHVHWHASRDFGDVVVQARLTSASLAPAPNRLSAGIRGLFGRSVVPISRGDLIFRSVYADLAKR